MRFFVPALVATLMAAGVAQAQDLQVKVDANFWEDELRWEWKGKGYEFRWYVFERGGQLTICGAGRFTDVSNKVQTQQLLRKGKLLLDGKPILTDLTFFTRIKHNADLSTATATCRDTGAKAGPDSEVSLDISGRARF